MNFKTKTTYLSIWLSLALGMLLACNNDKSSTNEEASSTSARDTSTSASTKKTILFFGNSLTAGYGLDPSEAFPALIQARIDSLKLPYTVVNAGVSGETSAGGNGRIDWVLRQPVAVFVLELGGNDGLRGIPLEETRKNLQAIIDKVRAKYPETKIVLAGMQIPPNLGQSYTQEFSRLYPELAQKNNLTLIPFLLEGVGGEARLNLQDGIHPTAEGHRLVADNVWEVLEGVL
ncbi:arylesterase [Rhabdobacter roseus]|uniref:Acyl-CoA thioesterase-1 n=1 Tax=Rhabdobacter roseus TaxID=1655419 RepID=A0A840TU93_9BACT|nr:acyl-CoA thioesterase-1 [Rhabdobacter roseus]